MALTSPAALPPATGPVRSSLGFALLESLRPAQWVKNGFVFAPLIFSRSLTDWNRNFHVAAAAVIFCLVSSAAYLVNDVLDVAEDRLHPFKRHRPVASGRLAGKTAASAAVVLAGVALVAAWALDHSFFVVLASYAGLNLLYSAVLKRITLLDVFVVAAGFLFRVISGAVVIHVEFSSWLIVCTTLLALFLVLSKRRHELVMMGESAPGHRSILANYSPYFLDQLVSIVTASTVMSYALYTLSPDVRARFPGKRLEWTIPFVLFGVFRYLYLVHQKEQGGNPASVLFADPVLLSVVLIWAASVILIIYL